MLQLQRPGEIHAVWVFWHGPEREFRGWYVNLQEPFRRTSLGFDTQDLELDLVVALDGSWQYKDEEKLAGWIDRGRCAYLHRRLICVDLGGPQRASNRGPGRRAVELSAFRPAASACPDKASADPAAFLVVSAAI